MLQCRNILAGAAVALAAVFSVGAGSSSSSTTAAGTGTPATATAPASSGTGGSQSGTASGSPITLGVECSCSGAFGAYQTPTWTVFQDWAKSVNASGGLAGHPVTMVFKDNGGAPGTALTDVTGMISAKVDAIIDL